VFVSSGGVDTDGDVDAGSGKDFKIAGTSVLNAGYLSISTAAYIGGNQVVGTRGAAVADATDAASAITQLNLLLARVRTHGLIAT
jgi:hypothetical protein